MLKIIGVGLVALCGIWGAVEGIMWLRNRAKNIADLEQGISLLRQELELAPVSIDRLMLRLEKVCEGEAKRLFLGFRNKLQELECKSIPVLWQEAVEELENIPPEISTVLVSVGMVLGRYGMREQLETLQIVEQRLGEVRKCMWEKLRQQEKIFLALSTSAGGFLIILLL